MGDYLRKRLEARDGLYELVRNFVNDTNLAELMKSRLLTSSNANPNNFPTARVNSLLANSHLEFVPSLFATLDRTQILQAIESEFLKINRAYKLDIILRMLAINGSNTMFNSLLPKFNNLLDQADDATRISRYYKAEKEKFFQNIEADQTQRSDRFKMGSSLVSVVNLSYTQPTNEKLMGYLKSSLLTNYQLNTMKSYLALNDEKFYDYLIRLAGSYNFFMGDDFNQALLQSKLIQFRLQEFISDFQIGSILKEKEYKLFRIFNYDGRTNLSPVRDAINQSIIYYLLFPRDQ